MSLRTPPDKPDSLMPVAELITAPDGQQLTFWHWPKQADRPTLHWAHANGFHARCYSPLLDQLAEHFNIVAWDMRGQGSSRDAGVVDKFHRWSQLYDDLATWVTQQPEPIWLAGHSMGGTSSMAVAARHPDKVHGVILCDPVLIDRKASLLITFARLLGKGDQNPMSKAAAARRATFDSRQAAWKNYRSKKIFRQWPDEWLRTYVEHGFVDNDDGTVSLACRPQWEAKNFENVEQQPGKAMGRCELPMLALAADKQSTFSHHARKLLKRRWPNSQIETVTGADHFLPMSHSDLLQQKILDFTAIKIS